MKEFWLVWRNANSLGNNFDRPHKRHESRASAVIEAERLATQHAGAEFFVVRAESISKCEKATTTFLASDGDCEVEG